MAWEHLTRWFRPAFCLALMMYCCSCGNSSKPFSPGIDWIQIPSGAFTMGREKTDSYHSEHPSHQVSVPGFEMSKTEVTVAQYARCVDAGSCIAPTICDKGSPSWGVIGQEDHPIVCLEWEQAKTYAEWAGARLPTEAEWEYAASNAGQDVIYPWGDDEASCDRAVIMDDTVGGLGCGEEHFVSVCSRPDGNTDQGLCDMIGNVYEWVEDDYHDCYDCEECERTDYCKSGSAPADGSAWIDNPMGFFRVMRGASWTSDPGECYAGNRFRHVPTNRSDKIGFRLARSVIP